MAQAAVVVTFNRKKLLCECLDALLHQTHPLDAIFVMDNASSDGTSQLLRDKGYLDNPAIRYIVLQSNLGGAGGFNAGMAAAAGEGFDWIWLMDDDTEPMANSLQLMQNLKNDPQVVAIANFKLDIRGTPTTDGLRLLDRKRSKAAPYPIVRFSSFVGLLIRRSAVERIGLPRSEFFIHCDDTEYCLRLRSVGHIALAEDSVVIHKEVARDQKNWTILGHTFYQKNIYDFCFDYFGHRNYAWIQQNYRKNILLRYLAPLARFTCFASVILVLDRDHRWLKIRILAKAYLDGLRGNFDNDFPHRMRRQLKNTEK